MCYDIRPVITVYQKRRDPAGPHVFCPWRCWCWESKHPGWEKRCCRGNRPRPRWHRSYRRWRCCWRCRANARCRCWCSLHSQCSWTPRWRKPAGRDVLAGLLPDTQKRINSHRRASAMHSCGWELKDQGYPSSPQLDDTLKGLCRPNCNKNKHLCQLLKCHHVTHRAENELWYKRKQKLSKDNTK